jgi:hypothetical protein
VDHTLTRTAKLSRPFFERQRSQFQPKEEPILKRKKHDCPACRGEGLVHA